MAKKGRIKFAKIGVVYKSCRNFSISPITGKNSIANPGKKIQPDRNQNDSGYKLSFELAGVEITR